MKTYRISFDLILEDDAAHPRKWVPDAIWTSLRPESGEDCGNWLFKEEVETTKEAE